jgi:hypothetical protein
VGQEWLGKNVVYVSVGVMHTECPDLVWYRSSLRASIVEDAVSLARDADASPQFRCGTTLEILEFLRGLLPNRPQAGNAAAELGT